MKRKSLAFPALVLNAAAALLLATAAPHAAMAAAAWAPDTFYAAGTIVTYNGSDYQALVNQTDYTGTGWNPTVASLWTPVSGSGTGPGNGAARIPATATAAAAGRERARPPARRPASSTARTRTPRSR
ncbi:carbohydrate-binding protein [Burkholderia gladioli]|uniref:carbohydrate-binding protein n=1 Tax=Burkholderia gladioli TaxID=28095 RepID=UPI0038B3E3CD